jgi:tRNA(Met) C34 N-acetyltransferase TmcA
MEERTVLNSENENTRALSKNLPFRTRLRREADTCKHVCAVAESFRYYLDCGYEAWVHKAFLWQIALHVTGDENHAENSTIYAKKTWSKEKNSSRKGLL